MPLSIIRNDITRVAADAIVNTANPHVAVGRGTDYAIYKAAGIDQLLDARNMIGDIAPGSAAVTPAFGLDAKYIIHTVGPAWMGGTCGERDIVASCYRNCLSEAARLECESIAFPLISAGTYGFTKDEALDIAIREITEFLGTYEMDVNLVVYDRESFMLSSELFEDIKSYIDDAEAGRTNDELPAPKAKKRLFGNFFRGRKSFETDEADYDLTVTDYADYGPQEAAYSQIPPEEEAEYNFSESSCMQVMPEDADYNMAEEPDESDAQSILLTTGAAAEPEATRELYSKKEIDNALASLIKNKDESFQQKLFGMIDSRGLTDPEVYKKANIDRKLFSKIRSNVDYKPTKKTAVAFAIALGLNLDETTDLLRSAGLSLSPSNSFDIIIRYCIEHGITNIHEVNCILFEFDQMLLGA